MNKNFIRWGGLNELTNNEFKDVINNDIKFKDWKPKSVILHHTKKPELKTWKGVKSLDILERFYSRKYNRGPHFFVSDKYWYLFSSPNIPGIHCESFNYNSWGVYIIHNGDESPLSIQHEKTLYRGLADIFKLLQIDPVSSLKLHRDDSKSFKTCPGIKLFKNKIISGILNNGFVNEPVEINEHPENSLESKIIYNGKVLGLKTIRIDSINYAPLKRLVAALRANIIYKQNELIINKDNINIFLNKEFNDDTLIAVRNIAEALNFICIWDGMNIIIEDKK